MEKPKSFLGTGWSFPPRFDAELKGLTMVSDDQDIRESLYILMSTMPGERVTNPEYGCDLHKMIFKPLDPTTKRFIKDMIEMSVLKWEPRITLEDVEIDDSDDANGIVKVTLHYVIRKINVRTNVVYPFYKLEGTNIVEL